jgi:hypothetical protein
MGYWILASMVVLGVIALILLRRERTHGDVPPLALGALRGCAVVLIAFAILGLAATVLNWLQAA